MPLTRLKIDRYTVESTAGAGGDGQAPRGRARNKMPLTDLLAQILADGSLATRDAANAHYYGAEVTADEILDGRIAPPLEAMILLELLAGD